MKWTSTIPTAPGWYWNRKGSFERGGPTVAICVVDDDLEDAGLGAFSPRYDEFVPVAKLGGEWSDEQIPLPIDGTTTDGQPALAPSTNNEVVDK